MINFKEYIELNTDWNQKEIYQELITYGVIDYTYQTFSLRFRKNNLSATEIMFIAAIIDLDLEILKKQIQKNKRKLIEKTEVIENYIDEELKKVMECILKKMETKKEFRKKSFKNSNFFVTNSEEFELKLKNKNIFTENMEEGNENINTNSFKKLLNAIETIKNNDMENIVTWNEENACLFLKKDNKIIPLFTLRLNEMFRNYKTWEIILEKYTKKEIGLMLTMKITKEYKLQSVIGVKEEFEQYDISDIKKELGI